MSKDYDKFFVGINIFVVKNEKLLLGKRKNNFGAGDWGLPGGHLENGESMKTAAKRELFEETGFAAEDFIFVNLFNNIQPSGRHYLQIGFLAQNIKGELELKEPDRCEEWRWFELNDLPKNIFSSHAKLIENFMKKENFSD